MLEKIKLFINKWWKKYIVDYCPPELEEDEFSDKYR
jgi:hypothetical protein